MRLKIGYEKFNCILLLLQILIILSMAVMSMGSLEPSGYHPPGSQVSADQYLPPRYSGSSPRGVQTPESHYLPSSHQSSPQNVIPNSRYLPSNHVQTPPHTSTSAAAAAALPTVQYLPARQPARSTRRRPSDHVQNSGIGSRVSSPIPQSIASHMSNQNILPSQYLPPSQRPETFTQAIPSSSYLPANQNQYPTGINQPSESIVPPSDSYLTPNMFNPSSGGYSTSHHDRHDVHSSSSSLSNPAGQYYPDSGYPAATPNQGYNYDQVSIFIFYCNFI